MCFCHTIASRYGALSGFGLSLAKWTLIVQHSTDLASKDNSWLWWLIMTFGKFVCKQKSPLVLPLKQFVWPVYKQKLHLFTLETKTQKWR